MMLPNRFYKPLDDFRQSGNAGAFVNALNNHSRDIERTTNMFVDLSQELDPGLELIDPALARCCHTIYMGKFDFLGFMSNSIHWDRSGKNQKSFLNAQEAAWNWLTWKRCTSFTKEAIPAGIKHYWPSSTLDDFQQDFDDISIGFEDEAAATELHAMILQQNRLLKTAKEHLRTLIKNSFSIEEILFQSDSHPYR